LSQLRTVITAKIVTTIPAMVTIRAVPSEAEPWTWEPIQSQPKGTPIQRKRQPPSISATKPTLAQARMIWRGRTAIGSQGSAG